MKLTLGFSPCPNDTFIFDALIHGRIDTGGIAFDVRLEDVETLNRFAMEGRLDISKLSYHAFGHVMERYMLLNAGSALGEKCGPLLIAREPLADDRVSDCIIAVPGRLTTANFLFSLEYPEAGNKVYMPFDGIESAVLSGRADAGVIIHENRFTYASKGLVKICDLGDRWEERTGFPIPLGGIAVKRSLPGDVAAAVDGLIRGSVRYAFEHPEVSLPFIREHAQEMEDSVMRSHIELYVNHYSEDLGESGRKAVCHLLENASGSGVIGPLVQPVIRGY